MTTKGKRIGKLIEKAEVAALRALRVYGSGTVEFEATSARWFRLRDARRAEDMVWNDPPSCLLTDEDEDNGEMSDAESFRWSFDQRDFYSGR